jgi:hypothetical protein
MTVTEQLCRHFSRIGARLKLQGPEARQGEIVRIDVSRDRAGEYFDIRRREGLVPEVLDLEPSNRHLLLMVRDRKDKNKFLLGHDERHWFAAAVSGDGVRDVRTAVDSLRPIEVAGRRAIRQGEWFFVQATEVNDKQAVVLRNEPLSRGAGSKPHVCEELMRYGGISVMVSSACPNGVTEAKYNQLLQSDANASRMHWRRMVRDPEVYARGYIRHRDHKTVHLDGWHRVYMNRERSAQHARQIAFLD